MDKLTLAETMEAERVRLHEVLDSIKEKRIVLDQEEQSALIEISGITAYLDAKMGKLIQRSNTKKTAPQVNRGPRQTGIKERVLEVVTVEGISKQDILKHFNAIEDKAMQQAVSNALVALKKEDKVSSGERGMYKLPTVETPTDTPKHALRRVKKEEAVAQ